MPLDEPTIVEALHACCRAAARSQCTPLQGAVVVRGHREHGGSGAPAQRAGARALGPRPPGDDRHPHRCGGKGAGQPHTGAAQAVLHGRGDRRPHPHLDPPRSASAAAVQRHTPSDTPAPPPRPHTTTTGPVVAVVQLRHRSGGINRRVGRAERVVGPGALSVPGPAGRGPRARGRDHGERREHGPRRSPSTRRRGASRCGVDRR